MSFSSRAAVGQSLPMGTLYDANSDAFLSASILISDPPPDAISITESRNTETFTVENNTYKDRFKALSIREETAASILANLIPLQGSNVYLHDNPTESLVLCGAVCCKTSTAQMKLSLNNPQLQSSFDLAPQRIHGATHVVIGIDWGLHSIIEMSYHVYKSKISRQVRDDFRSDLDDLKSTVNQAAAFDNDNTVVPKLHLQYDFMLYSDAVNQEGLILQNLEEVREFIRLCPRHILHQPRKLGWPLSYMLLPLDTLPMFLQGAGVIKTGPHLINTDYFTKFINLFDEFNSCAERLRAYHIYLTHHKPFVAEKHFREVSNSLKLIIQSKKKLKARLGQILVDVRSGKLDVSCLWKLYRDTTDGDQSPSQISVIVDQESQNIEFIRNAVENGATYLGHNGLRLDDMILRNEAGFYALLFNEAARGKKQEWDDNCTALMQLLTQLDRQFPVYIVDCDGTKDNLEGDSPRICKIQNEEEVITDLLAHRRFLSTHCFARYRKEDLDKSVTAQPVSRRFVKIPCPRQRCDFTKICEWNCDKCNAPLESGFTDDYIYCDCGRVHYSKFRFKCNGKRHKSTYTKYDSKTLYGLLRKLDQSDYLNILILGETGVGKSTFINAFINYLSFGTLDEAKATEELNFVIPCSFSTQVINKANPDDPIEEKYIRVGSRDDEADGSKGDSATQQTSVHSITIGSTTYRLMDTPGIGDTRGISYDKKNMADILETLGSYENLHGILILLKSNNSRLTLTFRFCVQELLVHLHRSASNNMAFGFTNTRISNYAPGDTFGPLKSLLESSDTGLTLSASTTYCFDSESFRYLAAYKSGIEMPNEEDFRRSWDHSSKEATRLAEYFKTRKPHCVSSTLSLNGTRQLITELTKPMAEMSRLIKENIMRMEDQKEELTDQRLTADDLRKKLHVYKITFEAKPLQRPRTICTNIDCCDFKTNGVSDNEVVTIYKTHCHPECSLDNVKQELKADPGLIHCSAFMGNPNCTLCSHNWQDHMHVLYELEEKVVRVKDKEIERQIQANADDVTLRQVGIKAAEKLIQEYNDEHKEVREAAARFGLFLKEHSMTPFNDATLDYISMLIDDEKMKIQGGRQRNQNVDMNVRRLKNFEEDKRQHIELVAALQESMRQLQTPTDQLLDEKGVTDLVARLYNLKAFGETLKSVKNNITMAHKSTNRERPFRVLKRSSAGCDHGVRRGIDPRGQSITYAAAAANASKGHAGHQQSSERSGFSRFKSFLGLSRW